MRTVETNITNLKNQLNTANERNDALNKTVNDYVSKIRELNLQIKKLEEELSDIKTNYNSKEVELENIQNKIKQIENHNQEIKSEKVKLQIELEGKNSEIERINGIKEELEQLIKKLKNNIEQIEGNLNDTKKVLIKQKTENIRLQSLIKERGKQIEELENFKNEMENKMEKLREENQKNIEKLIVIEDEKTNLISKNTLLQKELEFGKEQIIRRNEEYEMTIEALAKGQREAEERRLQALQELEKIKYDSADMQSQIENNEQRLKQLQEEYIKADNEKELLKDALKRFRASTIRIYKEIKENNGFDFRSIPLPKYNDFVDERGEINSDRLNDILQDLANRIENLQIERVC
uniref:Chromosome partition protein Smc n=1 Tax=Meloidogyne hapla TaxID=6305 RepID=A0A1I8BYJ1_MELHA